MTASIEFTAIATAIIALLALLISALSFFYKHIVTTDRIVCTRVGSLEFTVNPNGAFTIGFLISLSNSGTRSVFLRAADLDIYRDSNFRGKQLHWVPTLTEPPPPVTIQKGEFVSLRLSKEISEEVLGKLKNPPNTRTHRGPLVFHLKVQFLNVDGAPFELDECLLSVDFPKSFEKNRSVDFVVTGDFPKTISLRSWNPFQKKKEG